MRVSGFEYQDSSIRMRVSGCEYQDASIRIGEGDSDGSMGGWEGRKEGFGTKRCQGNGKAEDMHI